MIDMPKIYVRCLPEAEQEAAYAVSGCLGQLAATCLEFEAAVALFSQSSTWEENIPDKDERLLVRQWPFIAARVGALCLFDFSKGAQAIIVNLKDCPSIAAMVGENSWRRAGKLLSEKFPDLRELRNKGAAHPGEINSNPQKLRDNMTAAGATFPFGTGAGSLVISGSIAGDQYAFTANGRLLSYSVNQQSADALKEITSLWRDAFLPVEAGTRAIYRAQTIAAPPYQP